MIKIYYNKFQILVLVSRLLLTITNNLTFAARTKKQQQQQSLFVCFFFFFLSTNLVLRVFFFFRGQDWKTRRPLGRGWEQNNHVKNYFQARLLPYYLRHIPGTRRSWEKGIAAGFYVVTDAPTPACFAKSVLWVRKGGCKKHVARLHTPTA